MSRHSRSGFTLIELIVVTVLGSLVVGSALQILITNQRTYTAQSVKIQGQQARRAAMDILTNELREISGVGGDIVTMGSDSVAIRSMRRFGVTCSVDVTGTPKLTVIKVGDWFEVSDSVLIFADNVTDIASDDDWISARITSVDTTKTCAGASAQELQFSGQSSLFAADSVRTGASVRGFTFFTYGTFTFRGDTYLGRADTSGTMVPVVGPLAPTDGLRFAYLDSLGTVTTTSTSVSLIQVTLKTGGAGIANSLGNDVADSVTATIYMRN